MQSVSASSLAAPGSKHRRGAWGEAERERVVGDVMHLTAPKIGRRPCRQEPNDRQADLPRLAQGIEDDERTLRTAFGAPGAVLTRKRENTPVSIAPPVSPAPQGRVHVAQGDCSPGPVQQLVVPLLRIPRKGAATIRIGPALQ